MRRAKAQRYRLGLAALWTGWGLACVALLLFGLSALSGRTWSLLTQRHTQALALSEELSAAFQDLERLPTALVLSARDAADGRGLSAPRLGALRREGQPFCQLYWFEPDGSPVVRGDVRPSAWLWQMALRRSGSGAQVLRPWPPGLEAGRFSNAELELAEETPASYLAVTARAANGDLLLAQLDLRHVFGPWLKKRLERGPLGEGLSTEPQGGRGLPTTPPAPSRPGFWSWQVPDEAMVWRWSSPTFFASSPHPFEPIALRLDNGPAVRALRREVAGWAALALLIMSAFAFSIALTGHAVRRELQYAEARSRFTEMVSHELRTPLAAISMYGEILREGLVRDPDKIASYHALLAAETERLKRLVEDVLTFGRLQGQAPEVRWQSVPARQIAEQAASAVAALGATVTVDVSDQTLRTDPGLLVQILVNLLENATKHAGTQQPIELACLAAAREVVWEVRDRGPGVPEERRAEIFQPYTRVISGDGPKKSGVGLGLAVVEGLAHCLGGRVECRSRDGGGSVFAVILPGLQEKG